MKRPRVLIIEDEPKTASSIQLYLEHEHFEARIAVDGRAGLVAAREWLPDLIVLDLMLPEIGGLEVCTLLRRESDTPIIMLTARSMTGDRIEGLTAGADDYLPKPFSPRELILRIQAVLRRTGALETSSEKLESGDLMLDAANREVRVAGREVTLTANEFNVLRALLRAPGRVFTREELLVRAFGDDYDGLDRTVDVHIMNLRRKIEQDRDLPRYIVTVFGVGYKLAV